MAKLRLAPRENHPGPASAVAATTPPPATATARPIGGCGCAMYLTAGALFIFGIAALEWWNWNRARSWPRAEAVIHFSASLPPRVGFRFNARGLQDMTKYPYHEREHSSTYYRVWHSGGPFLAVLYPAQMRYEPGQKVQAYYNPRKHKDVFLEPGWPVWAAILGAIGAAILAFALLFVVAPRLATGRLEKWADRLAANRSGMRPGCGSDRKCHDDRAGTGP